MQWLYPNLSYQNTHPHLFSHRLQIIYKKAITISETEKTGTPGGNSHVYTVSKAENIIQNPQIWNNSITEGL